MFVSILSHYMKDSGAIEGPKKRRRGNAIKASPIYVSFLLSEASGAPLLVIPDCRLSDGILRPPSRMGNYGRTYFPQTYLPTGLDNPIADGLYSRCEWLADRYGVALQPKDDCLQSWVPTAKQIQNLKNCEVDTSNFVVKDN